MEIKDRRSLAQWFKTLGYMKGAEIGVARGHYSEVLCQEIPGLLLYCIDPWCRYPGNRRAGSDEFQENNYKLAKESLSKFNTRLMKMLSVEAAQQIPDESLDFVYIDGNHDKKYVLQDIEIWSKKVRKGGCVSGHDYYQFIGSGIKEAVTEYLSHHPEIELHVTLTNSPYKDERPSFYWIKP